MATYASVSESENSQFEDVLQRYGINSEDAPTVVTFLNALTTNKDSKLPASAIVNDPVVFVNDSSYSIIDNNVGDCSSIDKQILDEETSNSKNVSTEENTVFTPGVLRHILQQTILGQSILNSAAIGPLSEKRQLELAQIIAEWHLQNHSKLNERDLKTYSRTITVLFQFEKEDSYYLPKGGEKRNPGGKIYNKVNTIKTKLRKRANQEEAHLKKLKLDNNNTGELDDLQRKGFEAQRWLSKNNKPWSTVIDKWIESFCCRKSLLAKPTTVQNLIKAELWKLITTEHGYQSA